MKNLQTFYEQLGNLFYAIASADKSITSNEVNELKKQVTEKWLPLENTVDKYGSDAAHYITITFDYLFEERIADGQETWENFEAYYLDNKAIFTNDLKHHILETAAAIANAFSGANKAELYLLSQLTLLFAK